MATKRKKIIRKKKVPSPTGRPSRVNPDVDAAMRGEGGDRTSTYTGSTVVDTPTGGQRGLTEAEMMDRGMPLPAKKRRAKKKAARKTGDRVVGQKTPTSKIKIAGTNAKGGSKMKTSIRRKNPRSLRGA